MPETEKPSQLRPLLLLLVTIVLWGVNWPIMKIGIEYITPLWFSFYRTLLATLTLFLVLAFTQGIRLPTRRDMPILLSVGVLQIGLSLGLIYLGLKYVEPGRSAILTYTMPIWIAPLAFLFLGEKLTSPRRLGLISGAFGIFVLFNPLTFPWHQTEYLFGNGMLLLSALFWAVAIVHVRGHKWTGSTLAVLPWQMLIGTIVLLPITIAVEGVVLPQFTPQLAAIMLYNGPVASALGFFTFISATRQLPATTTGMTALGVPVVGMISSALMVGEVMSAPKLIGLGLICLGIVFANRK